MRWRRFFRRRRRADGDVRAHLIQFPLGNAANGEQIFHPAKAARLRAELDDGLRGCRADAGKFLEFFRGCGVDVDLVRGRIFRGDSWRGDGHEQYCDATQPSLHGGSSRPQRASHTSSFPLASYSVTGPKSAACSPMWARSPTTTICAFAESKWRRAAARTSPAVSARIRSRYVSR